MLSFAHEKGELGADIVTAVHTCLRVRPSRYGMQSAKSLWLREAFFMKHYATACDNVRGKSAQSASKYVLRRQS